MVDMDDRFEDPLSWMSDLLSLEQTGKGKVDVFFAHSRAVELMGRPRMMEEHAFGFCTSTLLTAF